jgi:isopentenyl phosphate kinase
MLKLSMEITRKLIDAGVPAVIHPPHTLCLKGDVRSCSFRPIIRDLRLGLVPVTYGDAIPEEDGVAIISGDDLASALAGISGSNCLIYVIDEPGVLDQNGSIVREIRSLEQVRRFLGETRGFDVTGGLARKISAALKASKNHDLTVIITDVHGLKRLADEEDTNVVGTLVRADRER